MLGNWDACFPGCGPVAHELREAFPSRWVRFHSLPGSRRYPEDEDEYATALARQNAILGELAGPGTKIVLLTTEYAGSAGPPASRPELRALDPQARPWRCLPTDPSEGGPADPTYRHVYASEWRWEPGVLDPILRLVADDVIRDVMVADPACRWLVHPYDGGLDAILESHSARDRLRASHPDWLSPRPDGL
jgi:hypothetical protein